MFQSSSTSPPTAVIRTILAVDDEEANRQLLHTLLTTQGYRVLLAEGGERAIELIRQGGVDLVLLDLMMPRVDGIEVCQVVRGKLKLPNLPVIFVTALNDRESRVRAKEAGADDFLEKPIDVLELLIRIENLLKLRSYQELIEAQARALEQDLAVANTGLLRAQRQRPGGLLAAGLSFELAKLGSRCRDAVRAHGSQAAEPAGLRAALSQIGRELEHHAAALQTFALRGSKPLESLDVRELLTEVIGRLHRPPSMSRDVSVHVPSVAFPKLRANRSLLEHMLESVLSNAIDATGSVSGREAQVMVRFEPAVGSSPVRFVIEDNGMGMNEATLDRACEPYFRGRGQGAGLGLCFVKNAAESLGGKLKLKSQPDGGTCVTIELPATLQETIP